MTRALFSFWAEPYWVLFIGLPVAMLAILVLILRKMYVRCPANRLLVVWGMRTESGAVPARIFHAGAGTRDPGPAARPTGSVWVRS